ncbi:MAG: hypothetical protein WBP45_11085 [Daejeonella sp.]
MKKNTLFKSFSILLILSVLIGAFVAQVTASPVAGCVTSGLFIAAGFADMSHVKGALFLNSINIADLATALGAYCREHRDIMVAEALLSESLSSRFEVLDNVTDEIPLPNLSITDLIKPADPNTFSATSNALNFGARIGKVRGIKVDLLLVPQVLEKTWLGKMKKIGDQTDLPFEKFIMDYISQKIAENLLLKAVYGGTYNAAGTTAAATMDGFLKLIADEITATTIAPVVTGAITSTNVIDKLELVYDSLGEAYKGMPTEMKVNPQIFDWYNRKYRSLYGANNNYDGMKTGSLLLDGTSCMVVREPGLVSSQRVMASQKENFVYMCDSIDSFEMDIQKFDRTLKILIDFKGGVQLKEINARALAVNDQA